MRRQMFSAVTLCTLVFNGCRTSEERAERIREQQYLLSAGEFLKFANDEHAIIDWQAELKKISFTVQLASIFVRADQRPFLFYALLEDIRRENSKTLLYFDTTPTQDEPAMRLVLACGACDFSSLSQTENRLGDFALVARISQARKLLDGPEDAPDYVLDGELVAARFVGDVEINKVIARRQKENAE